MTSLLKLSLLALTLAVLMDGLHAGGGFGLGRSLNLTEVVSFLRNSTCVPDDLTLPDATSTCIEEAQSSIAQATGFFFARKRAKMQAKIQGLSCIAQSLSITDDSGVADPISLPTTLTANATWIAAQEELLNDCMGTATSAASSPLVQFFMRMMQVTTTQLQGAFMMKCWRASAVIQCLTQGSTGGTAGTDGAGAEP